MTEIFFFAGDCSNVSELTFMVWKDEKAQFQKGWPGNYWYVYSLKQKISWNVGNSLNTTKASPQMCGKGISKNCMCGEMLLCQSYLKGLGFQRVDMHIFFLELWMASHPKNSWPPTAQRFNAAHLGTTFLAKTILFYIFYNWGGVRGVGYGFHWSCYTP